MKARYIKALFLVMVLALIFGIMPAAVLADGNGTPTVPFPQDSGVTVVYSGTLEEDVPGMPLYIVTLPKDATSLQVGLNYVPDANGFWTCPNDMNSNNALPYTIRAIGNSSALLNVDLSKAQYTTLNDGWYGYIVQDNVSQSDFNWGNSADYYLIEFYGNNEEDPGFIVLAYKSDATQATYTAAAVSGDASEGTVAASFVVNTADGGSQWRLTAKPADGYSLDSWQAGGQTVSTSANCMVTLTADTTYTACFTRSTAVYQATTAVADGQAGWGSATATETASGSGVWTLMATPAGSYRFGYWLSGGEIVSIKATCKVTPVADATYTAYFTADTAPAPISGQKKQLGPAAPASADGAIAAVPYTGNAAAWFTDIDGDALTYAVVSASDGTNDVSSDVYVSGSTIVYTPGLGQAGKDVTIVVRANDGACDSSGDVTITVSVVAPGSKCRYNFALGSDAPGAGALFDWSYNEANNGAFICDSTGPAPEASASIPYVSKYMNSGDNFIIYCCIDSFGSTDYNFSGWTVNGIPCGSFSGPGVTESSGRNGNGVYWIRLNVKGDCLTDLDIVAHFVSPNAYNYTAAVSVAEADAGQGEASAAFKGNTADGGSTWTLAATPAAGYAFDHWAYRTAGSSGDYTADAASYGQTSYTVTIPENRDYIAYFAASRFGLGDSFTLGGLHSDLMEYPYWPYKYWSLNTIIASGGSGLSASSVFVGEQAGFEFAYTLSGSVAAGTPVSFKVYAGTDTTAAALVSAAGALAYDASSNEPVVAGTYKFEFKIGAMPAVSQLTVVAQLGDSAPVTKTYAVSPVTPTDADYIDVAIGGYDVLEPTMVHILKGANSAEVLAAALEKEYPSGCSAGTWYIDSYKGFICDVGIDHTGTRSSFVDTYHDYNGYATYKVNFFYCDIGAFGWICSDGEGIHWYAASHNPVTTNFASDFSNPEPCWAVAVLREHYTNAQLLADGVTSSNTVDQLKQMFPQYADAMTWRLADSLKAALDPVKAEIDAIGTVTKDSGADIDAAKAAYTALPKTSFGSQGYYPYLFKTYEPYATAYNTLLADEAAYAALTGGGGGETVKPAAALAGVQNYIQTTVTNPTVGSTNGEWAVLDLARAGVINSDSAWAQTYLANLDKALATGNSVTSATDHERVTLALSSLGIDASAYGANKADLTAKFSTYDAGMMLNAKIFALIALDSKPYASSSVNDYVYGIVTAALPSGGWALAGAAPDVDMTAMAIQALAPYYSTNADVQTVVNNAITVLHGLQDTTTGGFIGMSGTLSTCSTAQVVTALCALGMDPTGSAWTTSSGNNPLTAMLANYNKTSGYFGEASSADANEMSTEQAAYALVAYDRFTKGTNPLYVMSDAFAASNDAGVKSVAVSGTAAVAGTDNTFTVELPHGSDPAAVTAAGVVITTSSSKASVTSGPATADNGATWTFTVTAGDGVTTAVYTVKVSVSESTTPPVFASGYPAAANITASGFDLQIKQNEAGAAYYQVVADGTAPGTDYANWTALAIPGSDAVTTTVSGLNSATAYDVYVIAKDSAGNWQSAPVRLDVATTAQTVPVTGVVLDQTCLTLTAGASDTLTATVSPAGATNKNVTWASDNPSVASVVYGVVTGVSAGAARITVTTADGGFTATCTVAVNRVTPPAGAPVITPSGGSYDAPQSITVSISADLAVDQAVYYTTGGADPTVAGSVYYTGPFQLYLPQGATTVQAAVYDSGTGIWSGVNEVAFIVAPPVQNNYDLNGDDAVNVQDLALIGQRFAETGAPGWIPEDINKDGRVNVQDLVLVGQHLSS